MSVSSPQQVTEWLHAWSEGDRTALDKLIPAVYEELRRMAHHYMMREKTDHVLQTTELVHETYLRLIDTKKQNWKNRAHFFAASAQVMRRILVDFARSRRSQKRGGKFRKFSLDEACLLMDAKIIDLVALDDAMKALASFDQRKSRVVELRYFGGLITEEIAEVLKISPNTVLLDWSFAKAWLCRELQRK